MTDGPTLTVIDDIAEPSAGGASGLDPNEAAIPLGGAGTVRATGELNSSSEFTLTTVEPDPPTSAAIPETGANEKSGARTILATKASPFPR